MSTEKIGTIANPAPLGLLGFGMTTILLNLHNAQIIPLSAVILAMGLCLGGAAQIIAGIMEFKKKYLRRDRFHRIRLILVVSGCHLDQSVSRHGGRR